MNEVIEEIETLKNMLLRCRTVFPTLTIKSIGKIKFATAPFYKIYGYYADIQLQTPITSKFIYDHNRLGQWINENAIIRLYGILEYYGFFKKIDKECKGWEEMDLLRRMRNVFTKTTLDYNPDKSDNIQLRDKIIAHFKLRQSNFHENEIPCKIPTPIDKVIMPIFHRCCEYIMQITQKY